MDEELATGFEYQSDSEYVAELEHEWLKVNTRLLFFWLLYLKLY
jgi:hypothetical protein